MAKETPPFSERSILVLGGAGVNSIGRTAVDRFYQLGTREIYIGTTSEDNFARVVGQYAKRGLSTDNLHPFVADVRDKMVLATAAKEIRIVGHGLTDVIFCHAGGMEGFMPELIKDYLGPIREVTRGKSMHELEEEKQDAIRQIMRGMREKIEVWREEAIPRGIAVNYEGTFNTVDVFGEEFKEGFTGVFVNSTWGHLSGTPGIEIPLLYGPVDVSKAMVRDRLRREGRMLYERGMPVAELIASLVRRTRVGKMFQDYLMPISQPEQATAIRVTAVDPEDVFEGIRMILERDPDAWSEHPLELFVTGQDGRAVFSDHLDLSAMYTTPYSY